MDPVQTAQTPATEQPTSADFFNAFGVDPNATPSDPAQKPASQTTPETNPTGQQQTTPATEPAPAAQTQTEPAQPAAQTQVQTQSQTPVTEPDKTARAFAAMRVQNTKYEKALEAVAKTMGLDPKNMDAVLQKISETNTQKEAEQAKVPVEFLQRVQNLEAQTEQYRMQEIQRNAYAGFQQLKDQYHLDDQALVNFATTLASSGMNPMTTPVDVVREYKLRNFDTLLAQAKEQGRQEEVARSSKGTAQGATVLDKTGIPPVNPEKITTTQQLTEFLNASKH